MEERNKPAEQENKKKPYVKPEITSEEIFVKSAGCAKCDEGPATWSVDCAFQDPRIS